MYLVRSGYVYLPYQSLRHMNHDGYLWSSTTSIDYSHVYSLSLDIANIHPAFYGERISAIPVHCIVRSGLINLDRDNLRRLGSSGYNQTQSIGIYSFTWANAYYLTFTASGISSSGGPDNRWVGFPVRCLVY